MLFVPHFCFRAYFELVFVPARIQHSSTSSRAMSCSNDIFLACVFFECYVPSLYHTTDVTAIPLIPSQTLCMARSLHYEIQAMCFALQNMYVGCIKFVHDLQIWVAEPTGREDLCTLVLAYLQGTVPHPPVDIAVNFYQAAKTAAVRSHACNCSL